MENNTTEISAKSIAIMVLGILLNWFILGVFIAFPVTLLELNNDISAIIICSIVDFILYLYLYGILGGWLDDLFFSTSSIISKIGDILGMIGFIIKPFPIIAYGNNKKYILNIFTALPMSILGTIFILSAAVFPIFEMSLISHYFAAALCFISALLILKIKKCKNCGRVLTEIDSEKTSTEKIKYYTKHSQKVGYVSDGNGNSSDINMYYLREHDGNHNVNVKTFSCNHCGTKRYGFQYGLDVDYTIQRY